MYIATTFFVCISVLLASVHANMISEGKKIRHGAWAALYLGFAAVLSWVSVIGTDMDFNWWMMLNSVCIRMVFFNLFLNKFRGLGWWYVTPELKNVTSLFDAIRKGRFVDYAHFKIFGKRVWLYSAIYLAASILITIKL